VGGHDLPTRTLGPGEEHAVRLTHKSDYAVRALTELAARAPGVTMKAEDLAELQGIPRSSLHAVLKTLCRAQLLVGYRGPEGGYALRRPSNTITLADVILATDGPMMIADDRLEDIIYQGPAKPLTQVWVALWANMKAVLEQVTIADVAAGCLPRLVADALDPQPTHRVAEARRGGPQTAPGQCRRAAV
jgi:Rrf2 family protein